MYCLPSDVGQTVRDVNCAGVLMYDTCESIKIEDYDNLMNINCRSVVYLCNLAIPHLIKTKGCIVNVPSVCGLRAFPQVMSYCMSKAALDQYTRCAALELAPKQVRVNAVNPGVIETVILKRAGMSEGEYMLSLLSIAKPPMPWDDLGQWMKWPNASVSWLPTTPRL
ncbi:uncharacterized protein LOC106151736 isoform X2 [Lingula anatina]|uniref:Uncharacterized protein LOC106151736 isoform X2 n=1 Tax=Lingula anatina TaxID=7574 RepID=A0A1S3H548_LINAN|nr:uncharacterized protein LOC106151736 isoform X2 [Lingula anatina]|eukprot:XP_013380586.1 uncharacterized protein LOC106151736 isoform X2 [Lingula anatina]